MNKGAHTSMSGKANVSGSVSYGPLLADLKSRVRAAQAKAALAVNSELVLLYWQMGHCIARQQAKEGWGTGVIPRLAADLHAEWKTRMVESLPKQLRGSLPNIEDLEAGLAGDRSTTPTTQF